MIWENIKHNFYLMLWTYTLDNVLHTQTTQLVFSTFGSGYAEEENIIKSILIRRSMIITWNIQNYPLMKS